MQTKFTVLISTSDYISKHSAYYKKKIKDFLNVVHSCLSSVFLEWKKKSDQICFSSFLKFCLLTYVTGYVGHAMCQWTKQGRYFSLPVSFILTISRSGILFFRSEKQTTRSQLLSFLVSSHSTIA